MSSFNSNSNPANAQNLSSFQFQPLKKTLYLIPSNAAIGTTAEVLRFINDATITTRATTVANFAATATTAFLDEYSSAFTQTQPQQMLYAMPPLQTQQPSSSSATTNNVVPPHHYNQQQLQQQQQQQQQYQQMQPQPNNMQFFDNTIPNYLIMNQTISPQSNANNCSTKYFLLQLFNPTQLQLAQPISHSQPQPQPQATQPRSNRSRLQTSFSKPRGSRQVSGVAGQPGPETISNHTGQYWYWPCPKC